MGDNPFMFSFDNKRYHTLNYYNKVTYGKKIYKAVLDCGFTCPNIDGSKGVGGCIFCDGGSGYFTDGALSLSEQYKKERSRIFKKYGEVPVTAYFQANTNTYALPEYLKSIYSETLSFEGIHGISIGTRADCLSDEILYILSELNEKTNLTVELGMQTIHEKTLEYINRCSSHDEFLNGYYRLKKRGIRTCVHIINGLPGESAEMMLETAAGLSEMHPEAVKIQMLHIIRGTRLAELCEREHFRLLSRDEYVDITVKQLEYLSPDTVIERITGDGDKKKLIAPLWSADKIATLGAIDRRQAELDSWQGKRLCSEEN